MLGVGNQFSENMFQKHRSLRGLVAAGHSEHNEADEPDEVDCPDEGKMVHDRQFGP